MSEELLIKHCSPTLAGIKTANIFTCKYASEAALCSELKRLNCRLRKKGVRIIPLKRDGGKAIIYAYRPARLKNDLRSSEAIRVLTDCGYCAEKAESCVCKLIKRLSEGGEFPHEIGFFLGYPPRDVVGFIENKARNYKCVGLWKVYGDASYAKRLFERYKKCTDVYISKYSRGSSLERLTVAI